MSGYAHCDARGYYPFMRRCVWCVLVLFSASTLIVPVANAGMISAAQSVQADLRSVQIDKAQALIEREDVRAQLVAWGVDPQLAVSRVAQLSDAELAQLADLSEAPAGSGVVGALVLIFIVLLITDILGLTDVFTFVKKR